MAQIQLDEAIRQFLDREDSVCATTLASAAEAIFGSLLKREGIRTSLDALQDAWEASKLPQPGRKKIADSLNHIRNQVKHAGDPDYDELEVTQVDAMLIIARACGMHPNFADAPTVEIERFKAWWCENAVALVDQLPDPGAED